MKPIHAASPKFLRAAAASPVVIVGDIEQTTGNVLTMARLLTEKGVRLMAFPELCLAGGYTNADLLHQTVVQKKALEALHFIAAERIEGILVLSLPLVVNGGLYNVQALVDHGIIKGFVPKTYLPNGGEFYEARWFCSAHDLTVRDIRLSKKTVPVGTDLLFPSTEDPDVVVGLESCEDLWTPIPPSSFQAVGGATIIVNSSASNELVGKAYYRRQLVAQQSGRCMCGYIYSCAGAGESTTDVVFGNHNIIAENGSILGESDRLQEGPSYVIADLDLESCIHDRQRTTSFGKSSHELRGKPIFRRIPIGLATDTPHLLQHPNPRLPFVPDNPSERNETCADIFGIQAKGLAHRFKKTKAKHLLIGSSGGIDSAHALLTSITACQRLNLKPGDVIRTYTMPGFGTTTGTKSNAHKLSEAADISIEELSIKEGSRQSLDLIGHPEDAEDITFENAQARYRTYLLFQKANQINGIVVGTGDLSEAAVGWCTYNGDHMSHYNVNCSVPKTLIKFLVKWVAENDSSEALRTVLMDILGTPISPELTSAKEGAIAQKSEDAVGPYELVDFFLYHVVRKGHRPRKILYLAEQAFAGTYTPEVIKGWLKKFIVRFFRSQFKRSAVPDGPKVGSVSLSPRGDWRMPSDASEAEWLRELED